MSVSTLQPEYRRHLNAAPLAASPLTFQQLSDLAERHRGRLATQNLNAEPISELSTRRHLNATPLDAVISEGKSRGVRRQSPFRRRLTSAPLDALEGLSDARPKTAGSARKRSGKPVQEYRDFISHKFKTEYQKGGKVTPSEFVAKAAREWRKTHGISSPKRLTAAEREERKAKRLARKHKTDNDFIAKEARAKERYEKRIERLQEQYNEQKAKEEARRRKAKEARAARRAKKGEDVSIGEIKKKRDAKRSRAAKKGSAKKASTKKDRKNLMSYLIQF